MPKSLFGALLNYKLKVHCIK